MAFHDKVSCLMVTADRQRLVHRSVLCFQHQTYPNRELVVVDDGNRDLSAVLSQVPAHQLRYCRIPKTSANVLGHLRNLSLEAATGEVMIQWDDDDWHHPERIARQLAPIEAGADASWLAGCLAHLNDEEFRRHPYRAAFIKGVPGSIMHRRDDAARYPLERRREDTIFLDHWKQRRLAQLPMSELHLMMRCHHGANTWDRGHFLRWLRNTPVNRLDYFWSRTVLGNLKRHHRFAMVTPDQRAAVSMFFADSRSAGLF